MSARPALLALLSAVLYAAAQPGLGSWPLAWIALVPLLLAASVARPLAGAGLGVIFALVTAFGVSAWLPAMIAGYFAAPPLAAWPLALLSWLAFAAIPFSIFSAWLAWACSLGPVGAFAVAAAFTVCEYVRANAPVANPWALLAASQTAWPLAVQTADLAGPWAPGFVVAACNALLAGLLEPRLRGARPRMRATAVVALLAASAVYGFAQLERDPENGAALRVALSNAGIEPERRYAPDFVADNLARQLAATRAAADSAPDVVFWPELALDFHVQTDTELRHQILETVPTGGFELVAGGLGLRRGRAAGETERLNSVFLFRDGALLGHTDKVLLMPFSETAPLARLLGLGPDPFAAGERPRLLHTRRARLGVAICSEAMHPAYVRRVARAGAEILVNPSQDGWFGSSSAARQQLAAATLRAIETRRFLVRPVAGGFAAVIDPTGRIVARSRYDERGVVSARVYTRNAATLYVRAGDWLPGLALAWVLSDGIVRLFRAAAPAP